MEFVFGGFLARVRHHLHLRVRNLCDELRQIPHPVRFRHLVEDLHALTPRRRVLHRQLDAARHVADVDERAGLPAGAVHGQRVTDCRLHEEAVEHGAVVAVVVEAVDQPLVAKRLRGVGAPDDALVQVRDPQLVVFGVVGEQVLVQHLGHVVDRARVSGVEDLLLHDAVVARVHLHVQVALRDFHAGGAVAVDTHGAQVHDVDVLAGLHDRGEQVVGGVDVVVNGVALVARALHRVRRGALLGEVDHGVGLEVLEECKQCVIVLGDVDVFEADLFAGNFQPRGQALVDRRNWRQRLGAKLAVDAAARQVVHDRDIVSEV